MARFSLTLSSSCECGGVLVYFSICGLEGSGDSTVVWFRGYVRYRWYDRRVEGSMSSVSATSGYYLVSGLGSGGVAGTFYGSIPVRFSRPLVLFRLTRYARYSGAGGVIYLLGLVRAGVQRVGSHLRSHVSWSRPRRTTRSAAISYLVRLMDFLRYLGFRMVASYWRDESPSCPRAFSRSHNSRPHGSLLLSCIISYSYFSGSGRTDVGGIRVGRLYRSRV